LNEHPGPIEVVAKTIIWLAAVFVVSTLAGIAIGLPIALLFKTIKEFQ
jgi:hypothetical protein